jgi:hypothetical protein
MAKESPGQRRRDAYRQGLFKTHLLEVPYGQGAPWEDRDEPEDNVPAVFVPVGLWVRAESYDEAVQIAEAHIGVQEDIDTGEAGHIKGGFVIKSDRTYRKV